MTTLTSLRREPAFATAPAARLASLALAALLTLSTLWGTDRLATGETGAAIAAAQQPAGTRG